MGKEMNRESLLLRLVSACPCEESNEEIQYRIGRLGCGGLAQARNGCRPDLLIHLSVCFVTNRLTPPAGLLTPTPGRAGSRRHLRGVGDSRNRLRCRRATVAARPHPVDAASDATVALHHVL